jgi:hypothetical protein
MKQYKGCLGFQPEVERLGLISSRRNTKNKIEMGDKK